MFLYACYPFADRKHRTRKERRGCTSEERVNYCLQGVNTVWNGWYRIANVLRRTHTTSLCSVSTGNTSNKNSPLSVPTVVCRRVTLTRVLLTNIGKLMAANFISKKSLSYEKKTRIGYLPSVTASCHDWRYQTRESLPQPPA